MDFAKLLSERRKNMNLGVRELARMTDNPVVPFPIKSPVYISRLENKVIEEMRADAISIDKLWALGYALRMSPLVLFASSREMPELADQAKTFKIRDCEPGHFSLFIHGMREGLGLSLRKVEELAATMSPWPISTGYLSQLETDDKGASTTVSAEKLWTLGRVYNVDPLLMYVLSRGVDSRYLSSVSRDRLFS